jgi:glutathione S-transferase
MNDDRKITLYHSPNTRSSGALTLLEELGVPYELHALNMKAGEQRQPRYLAVNPMGKVPALKHGDALITEQVAIFLYLADLFPEAKLAPPIGDPLGGPYLRWRIFYAACFEPAVIDGATQRDPAPLQMSPYGDFETMLRTLTGQLAKGPYLLGERFSAADVLGWGSHLDYDVQAGARASGDNELRAAGRRAAVGHKGQGQGRGTRGGTRGGRVIRHIIRASGFPQIW